MKPPSARRASSCFLSVYALKYKRMLKKFFKRLLEAIMAKVPELDAAIASVQAALDKLGADLTAAIAALQAAIGSGAIDLSAQVASLVAIAAKLSTLDAAAIAATPPPVVVP